MFYYANDLIDVISTFSTYTRYQGQIESDQKILEEDFLQLSWTKSLPTTNALYCWERIHFFKQRQISIVCKTQRFGGNKSKVVVFNTVMVKHTRSLTFVAIYKSLIGREYKLNMRSCIYVVLKCYQRQQTKQNSIINSKILWHKIKIHNTLNNNAFIFQSFLSKLAENLKTPELMTRLDRLF